MNVAYVGFLDVCTSVRTEVNEATVDRAIVSCLAAICELVDRMASEVDLIVDSAVALVSNVAIRATSGVVVIFKVVSIGLVSDILLFDKVASVIGNATSSVVSNIVDNETVDKENVVLVVMVVGMIVGTIV